MKLSYFLNINRRIVCQLSNDVITVRVARAHASPGFQNACATTLSQSIVQYILYRVRWNIHLRRINKKIHFSQLTANQSVKVSVSSSVLPGAITMKMLSPHDGPDISPVESGELNRYKIRQLHCYPLLGT